MKASMFDRTSTCREGSLFRTGKNKSNFSSSPRVSKWHEQKIKVGLVSFPELSISKFD
jgi:hypothetical protein